MIEIEFEDRVFRVNEAAAHLRISRSLLYEMIGDGRVKVTKLGTRTLIRGAELCRLLDAATGLGNGRWRPS